MSDRGDLLEQVPIILILKLIGGKDMQQNNISSLVIYRKYFLNFKSAMDDGVIDLQAANIALVGIARDLKILNPVLL